MTVIRWWSTLIVQQDLVIVKLVDTAPDQNVPQSGKGNRKLRIINQNSVTFYWTEILNWKCNGTELKSKTFSVKYTHTALISLIA